MSNLEGLHCSIQFYKYTGLQDDIKGYDHASLKKADSQFICTYHQDLYGRVPVEADRQLEVVGNHQKYGCTSPWEIWWQVQIN